MSIRYECYFCHDVFPAQSRIDGFSQGYKVGFLCPHCGKNIKDNVLAAKQRLNGCQLKWLLVMVLLYVPVFITSLFEYPLNIGKHEVSLHVGSFGAFVVAGALVLMLVPCTRKAGVILTEPVEKA